MSHRARIAAGAMALSLLLLLGAPTSAHAKDTPSDDLTQQIDAYLTSCAAFGWSGAAVVVNDGKVLLRKGYGMADRAASRANDAETMFEIASVTKVITACAVMKLVEDERIGLDDSIAKHLPDVPKDKHAITVRHLLTHTSGMSRRTSGGGSTVASAVASFLGKPLARAPGKAHEYWNGGFALLAALVESVAEEGYIAFCKAQVFEPAGMTSSGFTGDTTLPADRQARGYDGDAPVRLAAGHPYRQYDYGYRGMGGVVTTADDMWRFAQALWDHKIVNAATRKLMETEHMSHHGLGWGVLKSKRGTSRLVHGGDVLGFHTAFEIMPTERAAIIVMSNVEGIPMYKLQWTLHALLLGEAPRYASPPAITPIPKDTLDALIGKWVTADGQDSLHVALQGQGLAVRTSGLGAGVAMAGTEGTKSLVALADKTKAVLAAIRGNDEKTIRDTLPDGVFWAENWPKQLIGSIWPKQVAEYGALQNVRVIGVASLARGVTRVVLGLQHEKSERHMEVLYSARGDLTRLQFDAPKNTLRRTYMPANESKFVTFDWNSERPLPNLTVKRDKQGTPTSLVIRKTEFFRE